MSKTTKQNVNHRKTSNKTTTITVQGKSYFGQYPNSMFRNILFCKYSTPEANFPRKYGKNIRDPKCATDRQFRERQTDRETADEA